MNKQEAEIQKDRIIKFDQLEARRATLYSILKKMGEKSCYSKAVMDKVEDVKWSHDNPFTGNIRESRQISSLKITFTRTSGGEPPPVELELNNLNISAYHVGNAIEDLIQKQLDQLNIEIDKI